MSALERITARVTRHGHPDAPGSPVYLLTLDEYFEGNDVVGSIGCNLADDVRPETFRAMLEELQQRAEVHDIRVQITAFDMEWPFSDTVFVRTDATPEQVLAWFPQELAPSDAWVGLREDVRYDPEEWAQQEKVVACWWD